MWLPWQKSLPARNSTESLAEQGPDGLFEAKNTTGGSQRDNIPKRNRRRSSISSGMGFSGGIFSGRRFWISGEGRRTDGRRGDGMTGDEVRRVDLRESGMSTKPVVNSASVDDLPVQMGPCSVVLSETGCSAMQNRSEHHENQKKQPHQKELKHRKHHERRQENVESAENRHWTQLLHKDFPDSKDAEDGKENDDSKGNGMRGDGTSKFAAWDGSGGLFSCSQQEPYLVQERGVLGKSNGLRANPQATLSETGNLTILPRNFFNVSTAPEGKERLTSPSSDRIASSVPGREPSQKTLSPPPGCIPSSVPSPRGVMELRPIPSVPPVSSSACEPATISDCVPTAPDPLAEYLNLASEKPSQKIKRINQCVSEGPGGRNMFEAPRVFRGNPVSCSNHVSQPDWLSASAGYWESSCVGGGCGGGNVEGGKYEEEKEEEDDDGEEEVNSSMTWTRGGRASGKPRQKARRPLMMRAVVKEGREQPSESSSAVSGWDMYPPRGRSSLAHWGPKRSTPRIRHDRRKWVYSPDEVAEDERIDRIRSVTSTSRCSSMVAEVD